MKKNLKIIEDTLHITYPFTNSHKKTLLLVYENHYAVFENRTKNCEDMDGLGLSWKICDELVAMGLLEEDEEAINVYYDLSNDGLEIIFDIQNKK